MIPPGSTIGILGGGQLGRMLAIAAAQLGYRTHVYAPEASGPATEVAAAWTRGGFEDEAALTEFAAAVDVVTYEFENVPAGPTARLSKLVPVRPDPRALDVAQDRLHEKAFVAGLGGRPAPHRAVDDAQGLRTALADLGAPAILKTRRFGYDGKGQSRIAHADEAEAAWQGIAGRPAVLEAMVPFVSEFSILLTRAPDGAMCAWDAVGNVHRDGILDVSTAPADGLASEQAGEAAALTGRIAEALDYVGVLACEFFACHDGPVFNEMAPRVHNSGHWTIEGSATSQFENHIRAICGLPLGHTGLAGARVTMRNLIGDDAATWPAILAEPGAHLHLYGKGESRPGRKMGHVTRVQR